MHLIDLTYVERGIHEELVAYVADQQNYYQQEAASEGCPSPAPGGPMPLIRTVPLRSWGNLARSAPLPRTGRLAPVSA
jgi:hypothetical protein